MIARFPLLVITTRRVVRGDFERCTMVDDKDIDMEMLGGFGRDLTTKKSLWADFDATSFAGSEGGNVKFEACSSRCASSP